MIVVISIIAILAMVTYFILSGWRVETAKTEVMNQLKVIESEIDNYRNFNNGYPSLLTQVDYETTETVDVNYTYRISGDTYCLNGSSNVEPTVKYFTDTRDNKHLEEGLCTP